MTESKRRFGRCFVSKENAGRLAEGVELGSNGLPVAGGRPATMNRKIQRRSSQTPSSFQSQLTS